MAASHRACKATVDYTILSGKYVDMADRTQDLVLDCALNQLTARCSNNPEALKYFREQLLRDPVPQGVFVILTDKQWILSKDSLMCNLMGHPLNYEVGQACGDEVLYDALEFRAATPIPDVLDLLAGAGVAGPSSWVNDSSLNPSVLAAEKCHLDLLPQQFGLPTITDTPVPNQLVAGDSATLACMEAQKASQGLITSDFSTKHAGSHSLLPAATIIEAPRPGGLFIHQIPTLTEQACQEASSRILAPEAALLGAAHVDADDNNTDEDNEANEPMRQ